MDEEKDDYERQDVDGFITRTKKEGIDPACQYQRDDNNGKVKKAKAFEENEKVLTKDMKTLCKTLEERTRPSNTRRPQEHDRAPDEHYREKAHCYDGFWNVPSLHSWPDRLEEYCRANKHESNKEISPPVSPKIEKCILQACIIIPPGRNIPGDAEIASQKCSV